MREMANVPGNEAHDHSFLTEGESGVTGPERVSEFIGLDQFRFCLVIRDAWGFYYLDWILARQKPITINPDFPIFEMNCLAKLSNLFYLTRPYFSPMTLCPSSDCSQDRKKRNSP